MVRPQWGRRLLCSPQRLNRRWGPPKSLVQTYCEDYWFFCPNFLWGPLSCPNVQTYCGICWVSCPNLWGPLNLLSKLSVGPTVLSKLNVGLADTLSQTYCGAHWLVQTYCGPHSLLSKLTVGPTDSRVQSLWGPLSCPNVLGPAESPIRTYCGAHRLSYPNLLWGPLTVLSKLTLGPIDCLVQTCGAYWVSYPNLLCGLLSLSATHLHAVPQVKKVEALGRLYFLPPYAALLSGCDVTLWLDVEIGLGALLLRKFKCGTSSASYLHETT